MLSRVAENLYWMVRYIERAENTARLISVNAFLQYDLPRGIATGWQPLISIMGMTEDYESRYKDYAERSVIRYLVGDTNNPSSIRTSINYARENCRTVRDVLPRWIWEQLTELNLYARENVQSGLTHKGRHPYLKQIINGSQLITGILGSTVTRDAAYQFLRIGRNLERADMTTRIIDVRSASLLADNPSELAPFESIQWVSVLKSLTAYHMYRKQIQSNVTRAGVLRFLLQDQNFPRAVRHSVQAVEEALGCMPNNFLPLKLARSVDKMTAGANVPNLKQGQLHGYIDALQKGLNELHAGIRKTYFPDAGEQEMGHKLLANAN